MRTMLMGIAAAVAMGVAVCQAEELPWCGVDSLITNVEAAFSPTDTLVKAKVVFVAFPGNDTLSLPVWADNFVDDMKDYVATMSRGHMRLDLEVVRRPALADLAWEAAHGATWYASNGGYTAINEEVMTAIADSLTNVWSGVQHVFVIHYQCAFQCTDTSSDGTCEASCPYAGLAGLLGSTHSVPEFAGSGTTQRILYWPSLNTAYAANSAEYVAAHEFGHVLGFRHTKGSDNNGVSFLNVGKYDVMRAGASFPVPGNGLVPYQEMAAVGHNLQQGYDVTGWYDIHVVAGDTLGYSIPDIYTAGGFVVEVAASGSDPDQRFFLVNHAGETPYDAKYDTGGLLIWHNIWFSYPGLMYGIDLESAAGKFDEYGMPDPVAGKDSLEKDTAFFGSGDDVFDGVSATDFSCATNPNTNLYEIGVIGYPQPIATSVGFENIRRDSTSTDMIVDIYVTPRQWLLSPAGGDTLSEGAAYNVTWAVRPYACIEGVDVAVSTDGSGFSNIATNTANDGTHSWTPTISDDDVRIRVTSWNAAGDSASDGQTRSFVVRDITAPATTSDLAVATGKTSIVVSWTAPGDNGTAGTATEYDLRMSTTSITTGNFGSATRIVTDAPHSAQTIECADTLGLASCTTYYFALKTSDEAGNWSAMSNVASGQTKCTGNILQECGSFLGGGGEEDEAAGGMLVAALPKEFALGESEPNPVAMGSRIRFDVPRPAWVRLEIFDIQGRLVGQLANRLYEPGQWSVDWDRRLGDGRVAGPGVYLYRMTAGDFRAEKKLTVLP